MPPRRPDTPTGRASGVARRGRRSLHQTIANGERELDRVWSQTERGLRASMQRLAVSDVDERRIIGVARRQMRESFDQRVATITTTTRRSAQMGLAFGGESARVAFDDLPRPQPISPTRAREIATQHLTGPGAVRGISLSARLHAHDDDTVRAMAHELHATITAGLTVRQSAQQLLEVDDPHVHLPAYIREVRDAVRGGDARALRSAIDRHTSSVDRLSNPELRAAGRDFMRRAETATAQDLDRQIGYWTRDRALYQEEVIVRTEAARAHHAAFLESTRDQPWVKGFRWNVSASHPKPDICDLFANQAIDDLGPGGYTEDALPDLPAHPNCMCWVETILDDDHFERELAGVTGETPPGTPWVDTNHVSATDWLERQPESVQRQVLGPTRHEAWKTDPDRVISPTGRIAPVWQVEGRSPRVRTFVERVRVARVDPFREAASRRPDPSAPPVSPPTVIATPPTTSAPAPRIRVPRLPRAPRVPRPPPPPRLPPPPPPPAPPPPPDPAATARRVLATALRGDGRTLAQGDTRRALRAWLREAYSGELTAFDETRPLGATLVSLPRPSTVSRLRGEHNWHGYMGIAPDLIADARAGASTILSGGMPDAQQREALRTFFHEEMHGHSSGEPGSYRGTGRVLEETSVELHARDAVERLFVTPVTSGSYDDYIDQVRDVVRIAFPGATDIDDRIRRAARHAWRLPIANQREYQARFLEGLAVAPAVRPQVAQALRSLVPRP